MHKSRPSPHSFICICAVALTATVACTSTIVGTGTDTGGTNASSTSSSGSSGSSGASGSSTTSSDPCRPAPGVYDVHFNKVLGSAAQCGPLADDTAMVSEAQSDGGAGSFLKRAHDAGCSVTANSVSCTYKIHCEDVTGNGVHLVSDSTLDTSTSTPTGESTSKAGDIVCKYAITWIRRY